MDDGDRPPDGADPDATLSHPEGEPEASEPAASKSAQEQTELAPAHGPADDAALSPPVPSEIGGYRVVRLLGRGGMGTVFEAEQAHPRRRVALKVIRGGALVDEIQVRMFRREVMLLGLLQHPGIGAIFDAGQTGDGQHFFVMELVEGRELGGHLEGRGAPPDGEELRHRLELFCKICDAVHYAHQRGVIHRDLKPSNVVVLPAAVDVDEASAVPEIKILDFGLARLTDSEAAGGTMVSQSGAIQGTLPYMSPEQARGDTAALDLRTDVYSLGVILYELLTGARPYDVDTSSLISAVQVINKTEPRPLSAAWCGRRRPNPDLETIVGKALEKEPDRRYGSAQGLAEDLRRYLTAQPILARPPSTVYQLQKLVQRNKLPAAFAATVLLLIVGFGIWMTVLYRRAVAAEAAAREEAETTLQVSDFMVELFEVSDPSEARGNSITAREILDRGAERIEGELAAQPVVQARLLHTVGRVYRGLGLLGPASELLTRAVAVRERVLGPEHAEVSRSLVELGAGEATLGRYEEAQEHLERALALQRRDGSVAEAERAETMRHLAFLYREQGRWDEATAIYEELVPVQERLLGPEAPELAATLSDLGWMYHELGLFPEFEELEERALAIRERSLEPDHPDLGASLHRLADAYMHAGRHDERRSAAERALAIREKALGPFHPDVGFSLHTLGNIRLEDGRLDEAEGAFRRVLEIAERLSGSQHPRYGVALASLAQVLNAQRRYGEALPLLEQALAIQEAGFGAENPNLIPMLNQMGHANLYAGRPEQARPHLERALAMATALGPEHPDLARAAYLLATVHRSQGRLEEAERLYARAVGIYENQAEGEAHSFAYSLLEQAVLFRLQARLDEAGAALDRAGALLEEHGLGDEGHRADLRLEKGLLQARMGRPAEARESLQEALELRRGAFGEEHELTAEARRLLADLERGREVG